VVLALAWRSNPSLNRLYVFALVDEERREAVAEIVEAESLTGFERNPNLNFEPPRDNSRMVGNPYLAGLGQGYPLSVRNQHCYFAGQERGNPTSPIARWVDWAVALP
jgi:hypothetical protein